MVPIEVYGLLIHCINARTSKQKLLFVEALIKKWIAPNRYTVPIHISIYFIGFTGHSLVVATKDAH